MAVMNLEEEVYFNHMLNNFKRAVREVPKRRRGIKKKPARTLSVYV